MIIVCFSSIYMLFCYVTVIVLSARYSYKYNYNKTNCLNIVNSCMTCKY